MGKNVEYLESLQHILISSHEVINSLYRSEVNCSDPECVNYSKTGANDPGNNDRTRALSFDVGESNFIIMY